jgi:hypothetical protein
LWQKDNVLGRIIVKARVTDLVDVPHYLICSEGDDFEGVCHTVKCEIIQQNILGGQLQDEDIPPGCLDDEEFIFPSLEPIQQFNPLAQQQIQHRMMSPWMMCSSRMKMLLWKKIMLWEMPIQLPCQMKYQISSMSWIYSLAYQFPLAHLLNLW